MAGAAVCFLAVISVSFLQLSACATVEKRPRHHSWIQAKEGKGGGMLRDSDPRNSLNSSLFVQQLLEKSDGQLSSSCTPLTPPPRRSADSLSSPSPILSTSPPSFTAPISSSSLVSSRLLISRRLRPILEAQQDFPGNDPSLGRLLVDVVRQEMRGCSLVLVANGGYETSLALQKVLQLPNFRQVGRGGRWRSFSLSVIIYIQIDV